MTVATLERGADQTSQYDREPSAVQINRESVLVAQELTTDLCEATPITRFDQMPGGVNLFGKCESLQRGNSFKSRGAYAQMKVLKDWDFGNVCCASAGNFGCGVAVSAKALEMTATIVLPESVDPQRINRIIEAGTDEDGKCWVDVIVQGSTVDESLRFARTLNGTMVEPFNDELVVAAHGVPVLEAFEQIPSGIKKVFVPIGGGGLAAGTLLALEERDDIEVVIVQFEGNDSAEQSLKTGKITQASNLSSLAAGSAVSQIGEIPFEVLKKFKNKIKFVTVSAADIGNCLTREIQLLSSLEPVYGDAAYESLAEVTGMLAEAGARKYARKLVENNEDIAGEAWLAIVTGSNTDYVAEKACIEASQLSNANPSEARRTRVIGEPFALAA